MSFSDLFHTLSFHNLLPFLSLVEKPSLQTLIPSELLDTIHFYGIRNPPPSGSIFEAMLQYDLGKVNRCLEQKSDLIVRRPYSQIDPVSHQPVESDYRMTIQSRTWQEMNSMEVALLLEWPEVIPILQNHKRTVAHYVGEWTCEYGDTAIQLAQRFHKPQVANVIHSSRRVL